MLTTARRLAPGLSIALLVAGLAIALARLAPWLSPALTAVLAGIVVRNTLGRPAAWEGGLAVAGRGLLRAGIVLLGFQLSLAGVMGLGAATLALVLAAVACTFAVTLLAGRWLGLGRAQTLLVASGFSICGAAAVAAADGVVDADEKDTATAVGLVVVFGTLLIPALPLLAAALGLGAETAGIWVGASTHEIAQVVAAGGLIGSQALAVAVAVKLARILTLAPVMALLALAHRRRVARHGEDTGRPTKLPPVIPGFVLGFLAASVIRTLDVVPTAALDVIAVGQQVLLVAAMFALGMAVDGRALLRTGRRPFALGAAATGVIVSIGLVGALWVA